MHLHFLMTEQKSTKNNFIFQNNILDFSHLCFGSHIKNPSSYSSNWIGSSVSEIQKKKIKNKIINYTFLFQIIFSHRVALNCHWYRRYQTLCLSFWRRSIQITRTRKTTSNIFLSFLLLNQCRLLDFNIHNSHIQVINNNSHFDGKF